jgi:hypothetical protein
MKINEIVLDIGAALASFDKRGASLGPSLPE